MAVEAATDSSDDTTLSTEAWLHRRASGEPALPSLPSLPSSWNPDSLMLSCAIRVAGESGEPTLPMSALSTAAEDRLISMESRLWSCTARMGVAHGSGTAETASRRIAASASREWRPLMMPNIWQRHRAAQQFV